MSARLSADINRDTPGLCRLAPAFHVAATAAVPAHTAPPATARPIDTLATTGRFYEKATTGRQHRY